MRPCKVVISGGGVTGLTLALMLEKVGVDYILLEAQADILCSDAGTGICMLPNGLRILDQLGCYESLLDQAGDAIDSVTVKGPDGEVLRHTTGWQQFALERYGYKAFWCDRSTLLQAIYNQIRDKSKLRIRKSVESIEHLESEVKVKTSDGEVYHGDVVVGADGIHSRVRQEMARHAREIGAGEQFSEEKDVPSTYCCLFGISSTVKGISQGALDYVLNHGFSYIVGSGPKDRTYWALMKKLRRTCHGTEIPHFLPEDSDTILQEHQNDPVGPGVFVSDLREKLLRPTVLKPMREFTYQKWFLQRMLIIGDAAHQMTIIIAQGGNQAIESAAALTNCLVSALSGKQQAGPLSCHEIETLFENVQHTRFARVKGMIERSHQRQLMDSLETQKWKDYMLHEFPSSLPRAMKERWDETFAPAISLDDLEVPVRQKTFRWLDEPE
ncbi:2-heptyl-3-hydroxy-4(1H)-quinolone synthase [Penicillium subrubescens]|uniref:2-heptyl-3-hydroxy-4(1H)-quinolone synthase n=1 Tax=Penicillium subrubescens TaxID=1316194 RepID=A0A1Q5TD06_9EURO|nr:2-heptyl-3-hydroxy-4(1H)-quinolone synthase [Penicillium subrubescens]